MKKTLSLMLALIIVLPLFLTGCNFSKLINIIMPGSDGFEFISNGDGTCYVSGIGSCTDTDVIIPMMSPDGDTVTGIGPEAFMDLTALTSIAIPDSVISIGDSAFWFCTGLTSINIPDSVTNVELRAFAGCIGLENITVDPGNTVYYSEGNCLIEKATNTLVVGCKSSIIPNGVTSIGELAFVLCDTLTDINIPSSVTSIGEYAFSGCSGLTGITIPDSVTSIGGHAFLACSGLTAITIPDSITSIGRATFQECTGLTSVVIGNRVTSIEKMAFYYCTGLTSIAFDGMKSEWEAVEKGTDWDYRTGDYTVHCTDGDIEKVNS